MKRLHLALAVLAGALVTSPASAGFLGTFDAASVPACPGGASQGDYAWVTDGDAPGSDPSGWTCDATGASADRILCACDSAGAGGWIGVLRGSASGVPGPPTPEIVLSRFSSDCTSEVNGKSHELCIDTTSGDGTGVWYCPAPGDCGTTTSWERIDGNAANPFVATASDPAINLSPTTELVQVGNLGGAGGVLFGGQGFIVGDDGGIILQANGQTIQVSGLNFTVNATNPLFTTEVDFQGGAVLSGMTFPPVDGANGEYLTTNGAGVLAWDTPTGTVGCDATTQNGCDFLATTTVGGELIQDGVDLTGSPAQDQIIVKDVAGTDLRATGWTIDSSNNLTRPQGASGQNWRMYEASANGSNFVEWKGADSIASNQTWTGDERGFDPRGIVMGERRCIDIKSVAAAGERRPGFIVGSDGLDINDTECVCQPTAGNTTCSLQVGFTRCDSFGGTDGACVNPSLRFGAVCDESGQSAADFIGTAFASGEIAAFDVLVATNVENGVFCYEIQ